MSNKHKQNPAPAADAGSTETDAEKIIADARAEAKKILEAAEAGAQSTVEAANEEAEAIKDRAERAPPKPVVQDEAKRHIKSLRVCAVRKGYANHRIYEPGDKFLFRYWSHNLVGKEMIAVSELKALGGWMVTDKDARFGKSKEELQDVRVAESDGGDVTIAGEKDSDPNVL